MNTTFLISSPDANWAKEIEEGLKVAGHTCVIASNGKDCQLQVYKLHPTIVLLDVDTKNHSGLEVLKYISLCHPSVKVVLCYGSKGRHDDLRRAGLDDKTLKRMGIDKVFIRPFALQVVLKYFEDIFRAASWKNLNECEKVSDEAEATVPDTDVTRIKIEHFLSGNLSIFDYYIQLSPGRYKKILHKGEILLPERVKAYMDQNVQYLYFLTKERKTYINFMNEIISKMVEVAKSENAIMTMGLLGEVTKHTIDEIYTTGLQPALVEECIELSRSMYKLIQNDQALFEILKSYEDIDPSSHTHLFLVSFFGALICKNLDWVGEKTRREVALAAFLHDIGLLKLPKKLREKSPDQMNQEELLLFHEHPRLGVEMLMGIPTLSEQVRQIIEHHHEYNDGSGFPNAISGGKIYPLAKILSVADRFSYLLKKDKLTPLEGLREFFKDNENVVKHDSAIIKALIKGFIKSE